MITKHLMRIILSQIITNELILHYVALCCIRFFLQKVNINDRAFLISILNALQKIVNLSNNFAKFKETKTSLLK